MLDDNKNIKNIDIESVFALSMKLNHLIPYNKLVPRTISILPIARGCQAKCPFCFTHASISQDQKQSKLCTITIKNFLTLAKQKGVVRAVITGGGEPMMLQFEKLKNLITMCSEQFRKVVMITNGYVLGRLNENQILEKLLELQNSGLNILSISRHASDPKNNTKIMYLDTMSDNITYVVKKYHNKFTTLKLR